MSARILALLSALLLVAGCATVEIRDSRTLTGRVVDEAGAPVDHCPVLVVGRSLSFQPTRLEYAETAQHAARTTTDADGRYALHFVPATLGNNLTLFFYDRTGFDTVRYRTPEPVDLTARLREARVVVVDQILLASPTWPEVVREIAFYGADSDRGRILRRHGLPETRARSTDPGGAAEVWGYPAQGVSYRFAGDRLVQTQTFAPSPPAP